MSHKDPIKAARNKWSALHFSTKQLYLETGKGKTWGWVSVQNDRITSHIIAVAFTKRNTVVILWVELKSQHILILARDSSSRA